MLRFRRVGGAQVLHRPGRRGARAAGLPDRGERAAAAGPPCRGESGGQRRELLTRGAAALDLEARRRHGVRRRPADPRQGSAGAALGEPCPLPLRDRLDHAAGEHEAAARRQLGAGEGLERQGLAGRNLRRELDHALEAAAHLPRRHRPSDHVLAPHQHRAGAAHLESQLARPVALERQGQPDRRRHLGAAEDQLAPLARQGPAGRQHAGSEPLPHAAWHVQPDLVERPAGRSLQGEALARHLLDRDVDIGHRIAGGERQGREDEEKTDRRTRHGRPPFESPHPGADR